MGQVSNDTQKDALPPPLSRQLARIKRQFGEEILPELKKRKDFESKREKRRKAKIRRRNRKPDIKFSKFSPFAMTLSDWPIGRPHTPQTPQSRLARPATLPGQANLVSVFVIAMIETDPPLYVLQKIQRKTGPGFPGGGIEDGETILEAAAREFMEESNGGDPAKGVDIRQYNPVCIGKFVLNKVATDEQGAVVLVKLPESEIENLQAGGGQKEEEVVEEILLETFDEMLRRIEEGNILPNSAKIWDLYMDYLLK